MTRTDKMLIGLMSIAEGLVIVATLGGRYPLWTFRVTAWAARRAMLREARHGQ